jgi:imidazolonepropionase-like amidohydrolase
MRSVTILMLLMSSAAVSGQSRTILHAGTLIDGTGEVRRDVTIVVEGNRIQSVEPGLRGKPTYDLRAFTVLPGLIDTHVHLESHFGRDGRASNQGETPAERLLYAAENAYLTLMAGFTTVQSIGSAIDLELRNAFARGILPGPRLLTSAGSFTQESATPEEIRTYVRQQVERGADLIKIFASKSIREGGGQTLSDDLIRIACDEARSAGKRIWIHAHAASAVRAAANAGCTTVTHGSQVTDAELALLAQRGTFFEPNIGLVSQNYLENKPRYLGIGNYNEEGFRFMEEGIPRKLAMFKRALTHPNLKLIMGTDATAGAHGQNAREIIYRVQVAGQQPRAAILDATAHAAESLGLANQIGAIRAGLQADLIAVAGDPSRDITALRNVPFVMKSGTVFKNLR